MANNPGQVFWGVAPDSKAVPFSSFYYLLPEGVSAERGLLGLSSSGLMDDSSSPTEISSSEMQLPEAPSPKGSGHSLEEWSKQHFRRLECAHTLTDMRMSYFEPIEQCPNPSVRVKRSGHMRSDCLQSVSDYEDLQRSIQQTIQQFEHADKEQPAPFVPRGPRLKRKSTEDYIRQMKQCTNKSDLLKWKSRLQAKMFRDKVSRKIVENIQDIKRKDKEIDQLKNRNLELLTENSQLKSVILELEGKLQGKHLANSSPNK